METYQAEQLDVFLNQSAKMSNKNCDAEETDVSSASKVDNRSPPSFDNKDTQTEIVMSNKRDTNLITSGQRLEMTGLSKCIIKPQK